MSLYSTREMRRSGDEPTRVVPGLQSDVSRMSAVLIGPGPRPRRRIGFSRSFAEVRRRAPRRRARAAKAGDGAGGEDSGGHGDAWDPSPHDPDAAARFFGPHLSEVPRAALRGSMFSPGDRPVSMNGHCVACDA